MEVLRKINHKNIVYLEGVYETENSIYVVLEFIEGKQIFEIISEKKSCWNLEDVKNCIKGLLSGLEHLHKKRIMHRDIKP